MRNLTETEITKKEAKKKKICRQRIHLKKEKRSREHL